MIMRVPSVAPSTQPLAYAVGGQQPEAFGIGGQGLARLGQGLGAVANVASVRDEEESVAAVQTAVAAGQRAVNEALYHPETGFFSLRGKNAVDGREPLLQRLSEIMEEGAKGLKTDAERNAYRTGMSNYLETKRPRIDDHAGRQHGAYLDEADEAEIVANRDAVRYGWDGPPEQLEVYVNGAFAVAQERARRNGLPEQGAAQAGRAKASELYRVAIESAVENGDVDRAAFLLGRYGGDMDKQDWKKADALAAEGARLGVVRKTLQQLAEMPEAEAWKHVATLSDPRVREEVRVEYGQRVEIRARQEQAQRKELLQKAFALIDQGGSPSQLPAQMRAALGADGQEIVARHALTLLEKIEPDHGLMRRLDKMARDDPQQFKDLDLYDYVGRIPKDDLNRYLDKQDGLLKGIGAAMSYKSDPILADRVVEWSLDEKKDAGKIAAIRSMVHEAEAVQREHLGRELQDSELRKIVDRTMMEVVVSSEDRSRHTVLISWADLPVLTERGFNLGGKFHPWPWADLNAPVIHAKKLVDATSLGDFPGDFVYMLKTQYPAADDAALLKLVKTAALLGKYEAWDKLRKIKGIRNQDEEFINYVMNTYPEATEQDIEILYRKYEVYKVMKGGM